MEWATQTRMGIVQKKRPALQGGSELRPRERLRKCCVRTVTQNISETLAEEGVERGSGRGGEGGGEKHGGEEKNERGRSSGK